LELNPETGEISKKEKLILPYKICNNPPAWSPDGKYLLYTTTKLSWPYRQIVCIQSAMTNEVNEIPCQRPFEFRTWFPDGENILVYAEEEGFFKIDIHSGIARLIMEKEKEEDISSIQISPDNKSLYYIRTPELPLAWASPKKTNQYLVVKDLETGEEKELYEAKYLNMALSTDGKYLALVTYPGKTSPLASPSIISIMPSCGGELKEIYRLKAKNHEIMYIKWSPDDRHLYFLQTWVPTSAIEANEVVYLGGGMYNLWRIPSKGGKVLDLETFCDNLFFIHPDGDRVLYSEFHTDSILIEEIWVMENIFTRDMKQPIWPGKTLHR